jgi:hypothetical protein
MRIAHRRWFDAKNELGTFQLDHHRAQLIVLTIEATEPAPSVAKVDLELLALKQGWSQPLGLRLMPLADWLEVTKAHLRVGGSWAVDPFA